MAAQPSSRDIARTLRAAIPHHKTQVFHLPPTASPIGSTVELLVENLDTQPEAHLTDTRRKLSWIVPLSRRDDGTWRASLLLPSEPTILEYEFRIVHDPAIPTIKEFRQVEGRNTPVYGEWEEKPFKIAVYDPAQMPADWTRGMVIYQIFPDRFADGDPTTNQASKGVYGLPPLFKQWGEVPEKPPMGRDFFGGDLRGVIEHLDYIEDLGIDCVYFTPIFHAASNHRYEAINYLKIDPMLGTDADFDELVEELHARGMRIVLDGVFNHCSADSIYFQDAKRSKESPFYRWFTFTTYPDEPVGWWGYGFMPEFIECPEMEYFFLGEGGVTEHWLRRGIDGWRLDVAFDNTDEFWRRFRKRVNAVKQGAYLVSELWTDSTHYMLGDTFNGTMNYRVTWAVRGFLAYDKLSPSELDDRLHTFLRDTPPPAVQSQMNLLDSHDSDRILTACGGDVRRAKQCYAFIFAFPGAPMIYYGGETNLQGEYAEDGRRTMPWDKLDTSMIDWMRGALLVRRALPALCTGDFAPVIVDDACKVYGFLRAQNGESVYALYNASDSPAAILLSGVIGTWRDVLHLDPLEITDTSDGLHVTLPARGAAWLVEMN